jgi:hypothetical protein
MFAAVASTVTLTPRLVPSTATTSLWINVFNPFVMRGGRGEEREEKEGKRGSEGARERGREREKECEYSARAQRMRVQCAYGCSMSTLRV